MDRHSFSVKKNLRWKQLFTTNSIKKCNSYCVLINVIFYFLREIIQTFDISPLQARVAIVEFSDSISLSVALDNYGSKTRLLCAVDEIQYEGMDSMVYSQTKWSVPPKITLRN